MALVAGARLEAQGEIQLAAAEGAQGQALAEPGEQAAAAAVREVMEETGVEAKIIADLGQVRFSEDSVVQFFAMQAMSYRPSPEGRRIRWCSSNEALASLQYTESRQLITAAMRIGTE